MDKTQARKLITLIANTRPENIVFSRHAYEEMKNDLLTITDVWNVIKSPSARITEEPELTNGSWRYRLKTDRIAVVISFSSMTAAAVVTVWRIKP